jgi:hypothetical protein
VERIAIPISFVIAFISFGLLAKWYALPKLKNRPRDEALMLILFFHSFRYIGLAFLIQGVTAEALDPRFANPAAYGDLLASILALISILALRRKWSIAIALVWIFNIEGTIDLLNALYQGFRFVPAGYFGATFFIPAVIVPALLVSHYIVFRLLLKRK